MSLTKILRLTKKLYPSGRAWWMKKNSTFEKLHQGLADSENTAYSDCTDLLHSILPDNDNFTTEDATNWERALGLFDNSDLTLAERKTIIERKMKHPGNIPARQHYLYLQGQLQAVGFDVYVHENPTGINPIQSKYGDVIYGGALYGGEGYIGDLIANYMDAIKDESYEIGANENLLFSFFLCGETFPNPAPIPEAREKEFRELVLKIKPAQTVGFHINSEIPIPKQVPGLVGWYKISEDNVIKDVSENISQITDLSGNNYHQVQAGGSYQPLFVDSIINGKPVAKFSATHYTAYSGNAFNLNEFYIFIVGINKAGANPSGAFITNWRNTGYGWNCYPYTSGTTRFMHVVSASGGSSYVQANLGTLNNGNPHRIEMLRNSGGESRILIDGTYDSGLVSCALNYTTGHGLELGNAYLGFNNLGNVDIAEVIIYDNEISSDDITKIKNYLNTEYGV